MAIESHQLVFRTHAVKRMFQRHISEKEVRHVIENGEIIEPYRDDTPYPSRLVLGWFKGSRNNHFPFSHPTFRAPWAAFHSHNPQRGLCDACGCSPSDRLNLT